MKTLRLIENYLKLIEQDEQMGDATLPQEEPAAPEGTEDTQPKPLSSEGEVYFADLLKKALALKIDDNIKFSDDDKQTIASLENSDKTSAKEIIGKLVDIINKHSV